jgi:hypothetical protein
MQRRTFLAAGATAVTAGLAGCRSFFETRSSRSPPLVEDRPDAVYYPTHVEGMQMVGRKETTDYTVALTYSFPHRFWLITGSNREKVEIQGDDAVHLMVTVADRESGRVVPNSSVRASITKQEGGGSDGSSDAGSVRRLWPMLSQNMSVHAGDNVSLDGEGTYDVEVEVGPVSAQTTGAYRDRFTQRQTAAFSFEFSRDTLEETMFKRLPEKEGNEGALEPMEMEMVPVAEVPAEGELPGRVLGVERSGDGALVPTVLDAPPAGIDGEGAYLAVSMRTPYNRYPLPFSSVSATLTREGSSVLDRPLDPTFDPELGYHYGAPVDAVESGDDLSLSVGAPPQLARHEGYETAFFEFDDLSFSV